MLKSFVFCKLDFESNFCVKDSSFWQLSVLELFVRHYAVYYLKKKNFSDSKVKDSQ